MTSPTVNFDYINFILTSCNLKEKLHNQKGGKVFYFHCTSFYVTQIFDLIKIANIFIFTYAITFEKHQFAKVNG